CLLCAPAPPALSTLSLHDALPILADTAMVVALWSACGAFRLVATIDMTTTFIRPVTHSAVVAEATVLRLGRTLGFCHVRLLTDRSEEHTSELQSLTNLLCRLLLQN